MKVAYLAAGAGGMYCGSCMHDNRLAATLIEQGRDVVLLPLYTPLKTDEPDVSGRRVFYGGINSYLQQSSVFFRHTPWFFDRLLDAPALLRAAGKYSSSTRPEALGAMTLSVMRGADGAQRKELRKLIAGLRKLRPDLVYLPNLMFIGLARSIKTALEVPVLCGLAGEDLFLDRLAEPHRGQVFELIRSRAVDADGFVAPTDYYARHAAEHFGLPAERVHRVTMGIRTDDFGPAGAASSEVFTIGYLARICPEKGLGELCQAFVRLHRAGRRCRLRVAGFLGEADRPFYERAAAELLHEGVDEDYEYVGEVSREGKVGFLQSLDVLSVPATYRESKGFYVLEALAAGVPVVLPDHGSFPELVAATGGGVLHEPSAEALAETLASLMDAPTQRAQLGAAGRAAVCEKFSAGRMAAEAWELFGQFV